MTVISRGDSDLACDADLPVIRLLVDRNPLIERLLMAPASW
jgi:hypothetical protein